MARLARRMLLRGAAGATLALPWLEATGTARAHGFPRRLVVVMTPNGTIAPDWTPSGGEHDFVLGPILEPLEPHREDLLVLAGIDMESSYHGPGDDSHWNGMGHLLTGTELVEAPPAFWAGGQSVDQRIADAVGAQTPLRSLELAVEKFFEHVSSRMCYRAAGQPIPPEPSPHAAFERLFGVVPPARRARRRLVLDEVRHELASFQARLGGADRQRLDAHVAAVEEISVKLDKLPGGACPAAEPDPGVDPADATQYPVVGDLQMDLLVRALACDLTRVVTLQWGIAGSNIVHHWLGQSVQHHELSHRTDADAIAQLSVINRWYAERFAYLLAALKAVPEGDGTLLDHSVVVWCNELSEGSLHSRRAVPFVLAGSCGGYFATGRFLQYGGAAAGHVHNDLLVSLCHAMGVEIATFGNPAYCHGPLPGLTG
jgi:uncharacterized protein DUF1552